MIEKIKSKITGSFMNFIFDYADPSTVNKEAVSDALGFPIDDLFTSQKKADYARRLGKKMFGQAVCVYFLRFQKADGIDHVLLRKEMTMNKKILLRHLGKDKLNLINLIVSVLEAGVVEEKKGLLFKGIAS